jgi:flagellar P-ring protein precursor FlgI
MRNAIIALVVLAAGMAHADRIKDLTTIGGVRDNHLTGFGIVIGLDGTGDDARSLVVKSALQKMLKKLGVTIDANDMKSKNVAAVMITAELPPFAKPGMAIDITVSSMGNAKSLMGGTLLAAPLKGADQRTWAIAQGALSVGGFAADASSSTSKKNHTLAGTIPRGAIVEASAPTEMPKHEVALILKHPDFTTATRMRDAIGKALGSPDRAKLVDSATVAVTIPKGTEAMALIAQLEAIEVDPDVKAKVVVDEKTGTVVIGEAVTLRTAAITFGSLTVEVSETPIASQPEAPLGRGPTKVLPRSDIKVHEGDNPLRVVNKAATVGDVAAALSALGAKPRDLVSILRALRAAGALRADLETM